MENIREQPWTFNDFYCKLLHPSPAFDNRGRYEKCAKYWNSIDEAEQQGICKLIEAKLEAGEFVDPNPCFAMSDAMQEYEKRLAKAKKQLKKEPENLNMTSKYNQLERTTPLVSALYKGTYGIFTLAQAEEFGLDIKYGMNFNYKVYLEQKAINPDYEPVLRIRD